MRILILVFILFGFQTSIYGQVDTRAVLPLDGYVDMVLRHHPVAYQADLLSDFADSRELIAMGEFDTKIEGDWNHKNFDSKNYYSIGSGVLKIPTWYGVDIKAGYDNSGGVFLNDMDKLPAAGLWSVGVSVPLGRGLMFDERRAQIKQAEIYRSGNQNQRTIILNELLYEALTLYVDVQYAQEILGIAENGLGLSENRLSDVRQSFINGDKPAIDTVENTLAVLSRRQDVNKAQINLTRLRYALSNYLWVDGSVPLEMDSTSVLDPLTQWQSSILRLVDSISVVDQSFLMNHPELLVYDLKIQSLEVERQLYKEDLKPDVRFNYNPLLEGGVGLVDDLDISDYKVGLSLSYPLQQRKTRGKIQENALKSRDADLNRIIKQQSLITKLDAYVSNIRQLTDQYNIIQSLSDQYERLLTAERRKFEIGESSVFLVNSREQKFIENQYKVADLKKKIATYALNYFLLSGSMVKIASQLK